MNSTEIKESYSMADILPKYGLKPNKAGFISCPFHKERTASMRVYKDSYYCFGCGDGGDIFDFVQNMEDVSFKEAFYALGGTYEKPTFASQLAIYRSKKKAEMQKKEQERLRKKCELNNMLIDIYRDYLKKSEPLSDVWCDSYNDLQYQLYVHSELNGLESRW